MTQDVRLTTSTPDEAALALTRLIHGGWAALAVRAMAQLHLADHLAEPTTAEVAATATGTHAPTLVRLLRALAALGLVRRTEDGRYVRTAVGELLRSDHPRSPRSKAILFTEPYLHRAGERLADAVRSGRGVFTEANGTGFWELLAKHPEEASTFDAAMSGHGAAQAGALLEACDFSGVGTVVDVGGGKGGMARALLEARPGLRVVVADRAETVRAAASVFEGAGLEGRWETVPTDFFEAVPEGGNAYVLAQILHDWPDADCLRILEVVRTAMAPGARLWVIEDVLSDDAESAPEEEPWLPLLDLTMLVCFGSRERTAQDYEELLHRGGFTDVVHHHADTGWSVIEATPAPSR
jgi:DNA-binding transcriptional ArsR family regulator